jgi:hypothetical protein
LGLILETGKELQVPLLLSSLGMQLYEFPWSSGKGKNYFPVVIGVLEEVTGVKIRSKKTLDA